MKNVDHEDTILRTFILFTQTANAVLKYTDAYLYKNAELSAIRLIVLRTLASNNGVMNPSEIAEWTQTERHNITTLVRRLTKDGLVYTEPHDSDKRMTNVILTDKGREMLDKARPVAQELIEQIMSSFTEADAEKFGKMIELMRENAYRGLMDITKKS